MDKMDEKVNPAVKPEKVETFLTYKLVKQCNLVGIWIAMGMLIGVGGPTLPGLSRLLGLDYEQLARASSGSSVGFIIGAVVGGVLFERFYRFTDLLMGVCTFMAAISIVAVPFCTGIWTLLTVGLLEGFSLGLSNAGGNTMVLHLWGESSGPPMYALHFGFGLGAVLAPQIARPFLGDYSSHNESVLYNAYNNVSNSQGDYSGHVQNYSVMSNNGSKTVGNYNEDIELSTFSIPFIIAGLVNAVFAVTITILFFIGPPKNYPKRVSTKKAKDLFSTKSCSNEAPCCVVILLVLFFLFYFTCVGGEATYGKYIYIYCMESDLGFTINQAATLTSSYWIGHMTGRAIGMILSKFIPISVIIFSHLLLIVIVTILLAAIHHPISIWILTPTLGMLVSPIYPAGLVWTNSVMNVNSMTVMICLLGTSLGVMAYLYFTGYMFVYSGPSVLMYVEIFHAVGLFITFSVMYYIARKFINKDKTHETKEVSLMDEKDKWLTNEATAL